jgi:hypothetical protein
MLTPGKYLRLAEDQIVFCNFVVQQLAMIFRPRQEG